MACQRTLDEAAGDLWRQRAHGEVFQSALHRCDDQLVHDPGGHVPREQGPAVRHVLLGHSAQLLLVLLQ